MKKVYCLIILVMLSTNFLFSQIKREFSKVEILDINGNIAQSGSLTSTFLFSEKEVQMSLGGNPKVLKVSETKYHYSGIDKKYICIYICRFEDNTSIRFTDLVDEVHYHFIETKVVNGSIVSEVTDWNRFTN